MRTVLALGLGLSLMVVTAGARAAIAQEAPQANQAAIRAEVERLRQEVEALRQQYSDRLAALEARLAALEGKSQAAPGVAVPQPPAGAPARPAPTQPPAPTAPAGAAPPPPQPAGAGVEVPAGAAGAGGPTGQLPVYGNVAALSKIFNPDIAVIGDFIGAAGTNQAAPQPAFEMHETELSYQAIVDPYARADVFLTLSPEGIDLEEGYISFTSLPGGVLTRVGKMRSAFGKVNTMHNHVSPWTDRPLVTNDLVGGEDGVSDAGVSFARLIPNPWLFLEATGEVYRGSSNVFRTWQPSDLTYVGHLRAYQDLTESANIDLGTSIAHGHNEAGPGDTTRLIGIDATVRYRPLRRAIYRRFMGRTELIWSRRSELSALPQSFGMYVSGDYQFGRRWFAGARYDYSGRATDPRLTDKGGSLVLTYWPSEFSQVRAQYRRTRYAEGSTSNELLFQFLFSIGAHGAHPF